MLYQVRAVTMQLIMFPGLLLFVSTLATLPCGRHFVSTWRLDLEHSTQNALGLWVTPCALELQQYWPSLDRLEPLFWLATVAFK
jgi:hypothetical protein